MKIVNRKDNRRVGLTKLVTSIIIVIVVAAAVGTGVYYGGLFGIGRPSTLHGVLTTASFTVGTVDFHEHSYLAPLYNGSLTNFFQKYLPNVQIQLFPAGSAAVIHAMESGTVQVGIVVEDNAVEAIAKGAPIVIVATFEPTPITFVAVVRSNSSYHTISQLEGRTFAISGPGSFDDVMLHILAAREGWGNNYTEVFVGSVPAQLAAVLAGKVDATMVAPLVQPKVLNTTYFKVLANISELWPLWVVVATKSFIQQHPDEVRDVLQVIYALNRAFDRNMDNQSLNFLVRYYGFSPSLASLFLRTNYYSTDGQIYVGGLQEEIQFLEQTHVINATSVPPISNFYTTQFAAVAPQGQLYYNGSIITK
jgi:ABC-type nitrate/sulfonate/bicarbonate transport system substrate-binding protein